MKKISAKTILQKHKSPEKWFGNDYTMNLYRGCCHGCIYCDSRSKCYNIDNFDTVCAKENALVILRDELRRKIRTGIIGMGAMSDPYNPFEKNELLTRHALELISAYGFGVTSTTKSSLIVRDIDIYKEIKERSPVMCKLTITTVDDNLCRLTEPYASLSSDRFEALAKLSENGLFTGIMLMPVLPFIEDTEENILRIIRTAHNCGVRFIYPAFGMTMRSGQREYFLDKLNELFPGKNLCEKYVRTYGNKYVCPSPKAARLWKLFSSECDRLGILYNMKDIISAYKKGYEDTQLSFF